MRALASYVAGILTLSMLLAAGGAWSSTPSRSLVPVQVDPGHARWIITGALPEEIPAATPQPTLLAQSAPQEASIGCRPPLQGAECGPGELRPITVLPPPPDPYDLIPEQVQAVEDWRPLVELFFQPDDVKRALEVIACESRGDPEARSPVSTATGLFQHLASLWDERSAKAGWAGSDITDPVASVAVAAWLVYEDGGWSHWWPSRPCWD